MSYKPCTDEGNPFAATIKNQRIVVVPDFTLESGVRLRNVPVAYSTLGTLSENGDNAMVVCHALSGSADVAEWWGPLIGGSGRAFDISRFFIICLNSLGSPYGTASPVTNVDGDPAKGRYGPEFPLTTIRDDVNLHKLILDDLKVQQIAVVIGGSMGGMLTLEYAFFGPAYVRAIVPIATASRHSAWGISWGEAQRQSIYCDPKYDDGYYSFEHPPVSGLGAARMQALLTYRSRDSFESRFGRALPEQVHVRKSGFSTPVSKPQTPSHEHLAIHNDGHRSTIRLSSSSKPPTTPSNPGPSLSSKHGKIMAEKAESLPASYTPALEFSANNAGVPSRAATTHFSAQSYLRYQGLKFVNRFDSNCYIAITRKLDTHDVSRGRVREGDPNPIASALQQIDQPTLVIGIESDGLFTFAEQQEIAANIPDTRLRTIESPEGHDAFLLQFEQVNHHILNFLKDILPDLMQSKEDNAQSASSCQARQESDTLLTKSSNRRPSELEMEDMTEW